MNNLQLQDNSIYRLLQPIFHQQGYEPIPDKNLFRKRTKKGSRSVLFTINNETDEQFLDIHFGFRFDIIESLVQQFLPGAKAGEKDNHTILLSLHRLKNPPIERFNVNDKKSLLTAGNEILNFMQEKGFRFLRAYDSLRRTDATINRKPKQPCLYMHNQVNRCFKGIIIARLLHRNDFEKLITIYRNFLQSQWTSLQTVHNFNRLVSYLRTFSFN